LYAHHLHSRIYFCKKGRRLPGGLELIPRRPSIRIRAERRYGQIAATLERATPQTANPAGRNGKAVTSNDATRPPLTPYADALARTGVSRQQAARMQALARAPTGQINAGRAIAPSSMSTYARRVRRVLARSWPVSIDVSPRRALVVMGRAV
jgi:hypothetical protein